MLKKIGSAVTILVHTTKYGDFKENSPGGVSNEKYGNSYESYELPIQIWLFPYEKLKRKPWNKKLGIFHRMSEGLQWYSENDNFFQIQNWNCC